METLSFKQWQDAQQWSVRMDNAGRGFDWFQKDAEGIFARKMEELRVDPAFASLPEAAKKAFKFGPYVPTYQGADKDNWHLGNTPSEIRGRRIDRAMDAAEYFRENMKDDKQKAGYKAACRNYRDAGNISHEYSQIEEYCKFCDKMGVAREPIYKEGPAVQKALADLAKQFEGKMADCYGELQKAGMNLNKLAEFKNYTGIYGQKTEKSAAAPAEVSAAPAAPAAAAGNEVQDALKAALKGVGEKFNLSPEQLQAQLMALLQAQKGTAPAEMGK
jgi:hypothetical protein